MKIIKNILMFIGSVCVIIFSALYFMMISPKDNKGSPDQYGPKYDQEIQNLIKKNFRHLDYSTIYPFLSNEYKKNNNIIQLKSGLINSKLEMGWIEHIYKPIRYNTSTDEIANIVYAQFAYSVQFTKARGTLDINLRKQNGEWKIYDFQLSKTFINN